MENLNLIDTFSEFKEYKSIERETLMRILEDVFRGLIVKKYGSDENVDIIVNIDKGDLEIWRNREIVEDGSVEDENMEIAYSEAIKVEPDFENGKKESVLQALRNRQAKMKEQEQNKAKEKSQARKKGDMEL